ncbi:hypothetical protein HKO22_02815 [Peptoniphilus sp. AGMB00490]|uniref:Uncharacterized protein n=1 Tax=Peptoniphilus faecalis TaxID=2731255 RepID=A0A848RF89_9FIRM|nr:hypothetical protein [Peptoniphilus faecalis]NMW84675.1 hypothetical protein [Peptoniphilus faecalis]
MAYATIDDYNDSMVVVTIGGLQYPARDYDCFRLYLESTHMGWRDPTSGSYSNEAHVQFDITQTADGRTTQSGYYKAFIYGVYNHQEYPIPIRGSSEIIIKNGGGDKPPAHRLTRIELVSFESVEDNYVKVKIETDGYGDVDLVSVTKAWDLYRADGTKTSRYVVQGHDYIREDQLTDGTFYGTVSYSLSRTDLSYFPSVPIGTCHLASGGGLHGDNYNVFSKPFLCMSEYNNWTIYKGVYNTVLTRDDNGFNANVTQLSSVSEDWRRLVNMSFYLESTVYGTIEYTQYSDYIPRSEDIITANMYNSLLDSVARCCRRVGLGTDNLPYTVRKDEIISKYFIYDIGKVVDKCLYVQREKVNERVLGS